MKLDYNLITAIDFELSSICNAMCPVCSRTENGQLTNFTQTYWTLTEVKRVLDIKIIKNLELFSICGNYGDAMANPEIVEIIKWIREINKECHINLRTNGGIGNKEQYKELAKLNVQITFGIDGVGEKNNLYRVNVNWNKLDENLKEFTNNAQQWQTEVQFLLWNETFDQIVPLIEYLEQINFDTLFLRKPYTRGENTEVFDIHGRSTHFLTELKNESVSYIVDTKWKKDKLNDLKNFIKLKDISNELKTSDFSIKPKKLTLKNNYNFSEFEFSDLEKQELSKYKKQTCFSKCGYGSTDLSDNNYNIYITHDKYIMPCCIISPFINESITHSNGNENNFQKEILNKMYEIGFDKFNLADKSIINVFDDGVLDEFIYKNLEKNAFGKCKLICGKYE